MKDLDSGVISQHRGLGWSTREKLCMPGILLFGLLLNAFATNAATSPVATTTVISGTLHEAYFAIASSDTIAIAVGAEGAIAQSTDGGKTWTKVAQTATPLSLFGVAIRQTHPIVVGQQGVVLLMADDGKWTMAASGTDARLFGVGINSSGLAIAIGAFGTVIKSVDNGKNWSSVVIDWSKYTDDGAQPHLYDVDVEDDGSITLCGEFGLILRSKDGGASWQVLHKGNASLFALNLSDPIVGFAVGQSGTILRTTDHGNTWAPVASDSNAIFLGIESNGAGKVLATGIRDMLVSEDQGMTWKHLTNTEIVTSWYQGVTHAGKSFLAVGHSGEIIRVGE